MNLRKFAKEEVRVETGPIQFGDDWPGVFIRGDAAKNYRSLLRIILTPKNKEFILPLIELLKSCEVKD